MPVAVPQGLALGHPRRVGHPVETARKVFQHLPRLTSNKGATRMSEAITTSTPQTRATRIAVRSINRALERKGGAGPTARPIPRLASDVVTCASTASIGSSCPIAGAVEVDTGNGAASEAWQSYRADRGEGSFNKAASAPIALDVQIIPTPGSIRVAFHQPIAPDLTRVIKAMLIAQVHARGKLHHYRIKSADGVRHFVPRHWLSPLSRVLITHADRLAGRPLADIGDQLDDLIAMMDEEKAIGTRAMIKHSAVGVPVLCLERQA